MERLKVDDVKNFKVKQLKEALKNRNLSVKGTRGELLKRLINNIESEVVLTQVKDNEDHTKVNAREESVLKVKDFDLYVNEYEEFKSYIVNRVNGLYEKFCAENNKNVSEYKSVIDAVKSENNALKEELKSKQEVIRLLMENASKTPIVTEPRVAWQNSSRKSFSVSKTINNAIPTSNRFSGLELHDDYDENSECDSVTNQNSSIILNRKQKRPHSNRNSNYNGFPIDQHPERNIMKFGKHLNNNNPVHSSHSDIVKNGKRITIIGDSLVKRIHTKEFNKHLHKGKAFIKSFPGATADELNHYIELTLVKRSPDAVIIHAGANDVSRRKKDDKTIANDILDIARKCRLNGVKDVAISSINTQKMFFLLKELN